MNQASEADGLAPYRAHGPDDAQVVALGHSHVLALLLAIQQGLPLQARCAVVHESAARPTMDRGDEYWRWSAELARDRHAVIVWEGNEHSALYMFDNQIPFRLFPQEPDATGQVPHVPRSLIEESLAGKFEGLEAVVSRLSGSRSVTLLGTPPPKSHDFVLTRLSSEPLFAAQIAQSGADRYVLSPLVKRLALWQIVQEMIAERATRLGAQFVAVPSSVQSPDGALLDRYAHSDVTHANGEYGQVMWNEIVRELSERHEL